MPKFEVYFNGEPFSVIEERLKAFEPISLYIEDLLQTSENLNKAQIMEVMREMIHTGKKASVIASEVG